MPNLHGFLSFEKNVALQRFKIQNSIINFLIERKFNLVEFPIIDDYNSINKHSPLSNNSEIFNFLDPITSKTACIPSDLTLQSAKYFRDIYFNETGDSSDEKSKICYYGRTAHPYDTDQYGNRSLLTCGGEVANTSSKEDYLSTIKECIEIVRQNFQSESGEDISLLIDFNIPFLHNLIIDPSRVNDDFLRHFNVLDNDYLLREGLVTPKESQIISVISKAVLEKDIFQSMDLLKSATSISQFHNEKHFKSLLKTLHYFVNDLNCPNGAIHSKGTGVDIKGTSVDNKDCKSPKDHICTSFSVDTDTNYINYDGVNFAIYLNNSNKTLPLARGGMYNIFPYFQCNSKKNIKISCFGFTIYLERLY